MSTLRLLVGRPGTSWFGGQNGYRPVQPCHELDATMVFGAFIDVPLIVGGFVVMSVYRKQLTQKILGIRGRIPLLGMYLLLSVPLIIFEEDIDCMPAWCGQVLIPPTLPFIMIEVFALGMLALRLRAKSPLRGTLLFSVFGVFWEIFLGGLKGVPLVIVALLAPYVMVGYGFVSLLPLCVLLEGRDVLPSGLPIPVAEPVEAPRSPQLKQ